MNRLWGSKDKTPKPTLDDAMSGLDTRISSLDVKLSKLNSELSVYQQKLARMNDGPGKNALKQKALKILKQRKMFEAQKDSLQQQSWNMEQASMTTNNLRNVMTTVDAMKGANKELRKQYGKINIDKIESIQDEMEDLLDMSNELQETMSRSYAIDDEISDTELDAELEALGDDMQFETGEAEMPSYLMEGGGGGLPEFVDEPVKEDKEEVAA
ncbi:Snf7 family [Myxozyma melibiosi]|uniref:Snf7 family n=1 Tax=Myxozyma melibiosi TaxID=54550 RepID=A0ABR1EZJ9_9ASCO